MYAHSKEMWLVPFVCLALLASFQLKESEAGEDIQPIRSSHETMSKGIYLMNFNNLNFSFQI